MVTKQVTVKHTVEPKINFYPTQHTQHNGLCQLFARLPTPQKKLHPMPVSVPSDTDNSESEMSTVISIMQNTIH